MEKKPRVTSVALLLWNADNELYCVQELKAKPEIGKIPGVKDLSFPWETKEDGESDCQTLIRLILEEVDQTCRINMTDAVYVGKVWVYDTIARIYTADYVGGPLNMRGRDAGIEVEPLGFLPQEELLKRCRDGVPEVLERFMDFVRENTSASMVRL